MASHSLSQPSIFPQRIFYTIGMMIVEGTPSAIILSIAGVAGTWVGLIVCVLLGYLADGIIQRRVAPERQRLALMGAATLVSLWATKSWAGGGYGPLDGWETVFSGLFWMGRSSSGQLYFFLLAALYCFWRGSRLSGHDSISLSQLFARGTAVLMGIVGVGALLTNRS